MSSLFEAYITNLGKYNEGRLVGETLKFPATTEEVQALLKRIGVDGVRYRRDLGLYRLYGASVLHADENRDDLQKHLQHPLRKER